MKYYRVVYGYGKDDFYSIDETEVKKALVAQGTGGVVVFKEGSIAGNEIKQVKPDYQKEMGWNRDYQLTGEDYYEIGKNKQNEYELFLEDTKLALEGKTREERPKEISAGVKSLVEKMNIPTRDR